MITAIDLVLVVLLQVPDGGLGFVLKASRALMIAKGIQS
jgi:preprotein translocase subunit SecG